MLKVFDVRQKKINKQPIQYINESALKKTSHELGVFAMILKS
jgi:hypothetical protein